MRPRMNFGQGVPNRKRFSNQLQQYLAPKSSTLIFSKYPILDKILASSSTVSLGRLSLFLIYGQMLDPTTSLHLIPRARHIASTGYSRRAAPNNIPAVALSSKLNTEILVIHTDRRTFLCCHGGIGVVECGKSSRGGFIVAAYVGVSTWRARGKCSGCS